MTKIEKSCDNCQDYIVCYAYDKLKEEACNDWHLDFASYQKLIEEEKENEE